MTIPVRLLADGEDVVLDTRPHWSFLGWPLAAVAGSIAVTVASFVELGHSPVALGYFLFGLIGLSAIWLAGRWVRWVTTTLALTTSRVIFRQGVITHRMEEVRLDRLDSVGYRQTILERIFSTGTVVVDTGGQAGKLSFAHMPHPGVLQRVINREINLIRSGRDPTGMRSAPPMPAQQLPGQASSGLPAAGAEAPVPLSIPEQIEKLDELCRRGVISMSEFTTKKKELLERL
ncbi:MAG: PH domain-containing protein [Actinobacteria bacterium]|nr:PH domain-containing protein [Actinomycetota bacterium]